MNNDLNVANGAGQDDAQVISGQEWCTHYQYKDGHRLNGYHIRCCVSLGQ